LAVNGFYLISGIKKLADIFWVFEVG